MAQRSVAAAKEVEPGLAVDPRRVALVAVTVAVLMLVLLPCVVSLSPTIWFDVDPRSDSGRGPVTSLGPTGAAWLAVLGVLVSAAALAVHAWAGGRLRVGATVLTALGMAACAWHMPAAFDTQLTGGAWIAAAALGLAAVHLAEHEVARRWLVGGVVAILIPIALDAVWYVAVEHPMTIRQFRAGEQAFLESRGWEAGSPQHELYVRRLESPDAVGAFGLSNVLGSIVASLSVLGLAVALGAASARRTLTWALVPAGVTVLGLVAVWLTRSKGALLALPAGVGLLGLWWGLGRWPRGRRGLAVVLPVLAMMCVVGAFGVILLRGAMGPPETWEGERSLLFRWHYWQASARMFALEGPTSVITGVGPGDYQDLYLRTKNPLNPEEVISAHNVFVDYIVMLGLGGLAWSALLLAWLWQAGRAAGRADEGRTAPAEASEVPVRMTWSTMAPAGAVAVVIFGTQYVVQQPAMTIETALLWLVGAIAFVLAATVIAQLTAARRTWTVTGLFAAAAVVLVHNQIEMTFYQMSSAALVWVIVATSAGPARKVRPTTQETDEATDGDAPAGASPRGLLVSAGGMALVAVLLAVLHARPVSAHQAHLVEAARALQVGNPRAALAALDAAGEAIPNDPRVLQWQVRLYLEMAGAMQQMGRPDVARDAVTEALRRVEQGEQRGLPVRRVERLRASLHEFAAEVLGERDRLGEAAEALRRVVAINPYSLHDHVHLADLLWRLGDRDEAAELYREALRISDQLYLDPAKQLTTEERQRVAARAKP